VKFALRSTGGALFAASLLSNPSVSLAQEATETVLPPVKVIATKEGYRSEDGGAINKLDVPLKDIPQSINIITESVIRDREVLRLNEIIDTAPGVQGGTGYGGLANGYGFYMRGFFAGTTLRDGFRDFTFVSPRDPALFERVEIMKGPASVLYGSNEPGGIVNFVSKRPQFDPSRTVSLTYGSYDTRRAVADLTGPIDEESRLSYRLILVGDKRGSHRDHVESETQVVAPSVRWRATPDTDINFSAEWIRHDYTFERGFLGEAAFLELPRERFLEEPGMNYADAESSRARLEATHRFNAEWSMRVGLSSIRPRITKLNFYPMSFDPVTRELTRSADFSREKTKDDGVQAELNGKLTTGGVKHTFVGGVEAFKSSFWYTFAPFNQSSTINIDNPQYGQVLLPPSFFDTVAFGNEYGSRTVAVYAQDSIEFTPQWKANIGLRHDRARLFSDDLVDPSQSLRRQTQQRTSPRAGLVYQPTENSTAYLSYSSSFNPQIFYPMANGDLPKPEIGKQWELGWRQEWMQKNLSSHFAVFDLRKQNVTYEVTPGVNAQSGEQRSHGVEFELLGRPMRGLEGTVAVALIDARVRKDTPEMEGDRLATQPKWSASTWWTYRSATGWFGGGGLFYLGKREASLPNNGVQIPAQTRIDAMLGYAAKAWEVQLNLNNLTDEDTYVRSGFITPGPGRHAYLTARFNF
jgi:iron complex outermembrane recepter protein